MPRPYRPWTNRDVEKLKRVYPITNRAQLQAEFPNRNIYSLMSMAASLKLKKAIAVAGRKNWSSIPNATRILGKAQGYLGLPLRDEVLMKMARALVESKGK